MKPLRAMLRTAQQLVKTCVLEQENRNMAEIFKYGYLCGYLDATEDISQTEKEVK